MADISSFGTRIQVQASQTFPGGFTVTQFADDADPFDTPSLQVRDKAMGLNGDLITWSRANPITFSLSVTPNSDDDNNLSVLLEANRVGRGKQGSRDVVNITIVYPDGRTASFTEGVITDGPPALSSASAGRLKSRTYMFAFENVTRT